MEGCKLISIISSANDSEKVYLHKKEMAMTALIRLKEHAGIRNALFCLPKDHDEPPSFDDIINFF